ncbi:protein of unknown function [Pustulibacterium marinum]|uniref:Carbohydrate-binding domain-containing protein n=1 Tax=Pustulibacterium marinum TaxID=1224947 RepID=A0A1I7IPU6_9FLAO|nr:carbohydrate-binding domain-containing protein [Pustulibacterium marinum]SFU74914.1 protein of unknown function [Pustulibacterium marinum]
MSNSKIYVLLGCMALLCTTSCFEDEMIYSYQEGSEDGETIDNSEVEEIIASYQLTTEEAMDENIASHAEEDDTSWDDTDFTLITLNSSSIAIDGDGATASGSVATITNGGNYKIEGSLTDGQIIVDTEDETTVKIYLDGITVHNSTNAPFNVASAEKVIVFLGENTTSTFTDTTTYVFEEDDDEPNASFFSKSNMTITGAGTLNVTGNYNDGIASKDGLIISENATINVTALDDGIRGKDYLIIDDATLNVSSQGDGLKSDNDDDSTYGYIYISSGTLTITSGNDGIQAESDVLIADGTINIISGGGSSVVLGEDDDSAKAIKSESYIIVDTGSIEISAADDAFNTAGNLIINGGSFNIATGDDALHADYTAAIFDGSITVTDSYEGLEGSIVIVAGGSSYFTSSDDGINAAGDDDSVDKAIYISGGYTVVDADGDGIDSNGSIDMIDGTVIVNGPTNSGNAALDYDDYFSINGGNFIAAGSSGMAQTAGSGSAQYAVLISLNSSQVAGTLINISDSEGTSIVSFAPSKSYQSIAFSSEDLTEGETYTISLGGTDTGNETDGWYEDGTYSGGTTYATFTIENTVTTIQ